MSSNFFTANPTATDMHYIAVDTMMTRHRSMPHLFVKLGKNSLAANAFGTTHRNDQSFCISSEENILLVIETADVFLKNDLRPVPF